MVDNHEKVIIKLNNFTIAEKEMTFSEIKEAESESVFFCKNFWKIDIILSRHID